MAQMHLTANVLHGTPGFIRDTSISSFDEPDRMKALQLLDFSKAHECLPPSRLFTNLVTHTWVDLGSKLLSHSLVLCRQPTA